MNATLKKTLLGLAVVGMFSAPAAFAMGQTDEADNAKVTFDKELTLITDIYLSGTPTITGNINIDSASIAIVDNAQSNDNNWGFNSQLTNDASASGNAAQNVSGNVGLNIAAGDNNQQDNAAALSAADASFAFGMADAEVFVNQMGAMNTTANVGVSNTASLGDNNFSAASGNIGVNVTSGNNNQQKNAMAASVATTNYAQASVSSNQSSYSNMTDNSPFQETITTKQSFSLSFSGLGSYSGSGAGSANLGLTGGVDQTQDYYPDVWNGLTHNGTGTSGLGHIDLDNNNTYGQNPSDINGDGGGLSFGFYKDAAASGPLGFQESGALDLATVAGNAMVSVDQYIYAGATNTASLSGNAFSGASGNIGINVSAGTGNQQANSLALAVAQPSGGTPPPPPGEL